MAGHSLNNKQNLDKKTFEIIFKSYFPILCTYAQKYVHDLDTAKEVVHNVFIHLWKIRDTVNTEKPLKSYLYTSVRNRCLNYIRDDKKFNHEIQPDNPGVEPLTEPADYLAETELAEKINQAIDSLPKRCREIFIMNRFDEIKYHEIATKLNISIKTVETQMSKALKLLRNKLIHYLSILFLWMDIMIRNL